MVLAWAIIVLLILLTGLYVAAEFAAVSARRSRLRRLSEDGNTLAARLLPVLEDPRALRHASTPDSGIDGGSGRARVSDHPGRDPGRAGAQVAGAAEPDKSRP